MSNTVIQTENLTRDFGSVRAVDHITFEVPRGIVFGFLGPNGSGKTTTIRLLLGLLEPSEGTAQVLGHDTRQDADPIRQSSGALLEHTGLYERLSALNNLEFYARVWGLSSSDRSVRIRELLTHLNLWDRRNDIIGTWSRGMKQKLAIARVLLHRPALVFLDEPTAGLDPIAAAALRDDLANLVNRQGLSVFLTTHNLGEAEKLCSHVAVIRQGKLIASGTPDSLRARSGGPRAEIFGRGFTPTALEAVRQRPEVAQVSDQLNGHLLVELKEEADMAPVINTLVQHGAQIEEVRRGKASLEDVFLTLMEEETTNEE